MLYYSHIIDGDKVVWKEQISSPVQAELSESRKPEEINENITVITDETRLEDGA